MKTDDSTKRVGVIGSPTGRILAPAVIGSLIASMAGHVPAHDPRPRRLILDTGGDHAGEKARRLKAKARIERNRIRKITASAARVAEFHKFVQANRRIVASASKAAAAFRNLGDVTDLYSLDHPVYGKIAPHVTDRRERKALFWASMYAIDSAKIKQHP